MRLVCFSEYTKFMVMGLKIQHRFGSRYDYHHHRDFHWKLRDRSRYDLNHSELLGSVFRHFFPSFQLLSLMLKLL